MIQRFIELGEGYSDLYELLEIARNQSHRVRHLMILNTEKEERKLSSFLVILEPTSVGSFQPLYICREGIAVTDQKSKRLLLFEALAEDLGKTIITLDVKPSTFFGEKELYFQHLIGILRMNRYIPPLS
ncbi:methylthioribose kinase [Priestia filamentosa]|uniref:DUF7147 family protein n=1 Tax=Priestia filamentosa TaxID=1402861 RepID=UPI001FB2233C|nr:methylthioribose kinase [Priestia filamentosa]UOE61629.1 methylthioribose kinase [Priestia filamentosa]